MYSPGRAQVGSFLAPIQNQLRPGHTVSNIMTNNNKKVNNRQKQRNQPIVLARQLAQFQSSKTRNRKARRKIASSQNSNVTSRALVLRSQPSSGLVSGRQANVKGIPGGATLPQFLIANIDPFSEKAFGVKVPDEATMPSAVAFSRDLVPLSVGTTFAGTGAVFRYASNAAIVPLVPTSSTSWAAPTYASSVAVSNAAQLNSNFGLLRTVAFGIKLETRQSAFNAAGFVHIALVPEALEGTTTFVYPTSVSGMEYAPYYKRIPIADLIEDEITVNGKYTDPGTAFRYYQANFSDIATPYPSAFQSSGWSGILVWVEAPGLSITNAVDVEFIHHYEALTNNTGAGGVIETTRAAPHSPAIMAATSYVNDCVDPIQVNREDEENQGNFWSYAEKLFPIGLKIATGVFPVLAPLNAMFSSMKM